MLFIPEGDIRIKDLTWCWKINSSQSLSRQYAYGDYYLAINTISQSNSENYSVGTNVISLNSAINDYYDAIDSAIAMWSGTW